MKKFVSIVLSIVVFISTFTFTAFADGAIACPSCGGEVSKHGFQLIGIYAYFYQCQDCKKWSFADGVGGLKLLGVGDAALLDTADENTLMKFVFTNSHFLKAEKAPTGIGRKDLPGYASDDGTPNYNSSGELQIVVYPSVSYYDSSLKQDIYLDYPFDFHVSYNDYIVFYKNNNVKYTYFNNSGNTSGSLYFGFKYKFEAPLSGYYYISSKQKIVSKPSYNDDNPRYVNINAYHAKLKSGDVVDGYSSALYSYFSIRKDGAPFTYDFNLLPIRYTVIPDTPTVTQQTNITINKNTWNGNIYVDNSTNLTYIYPQYTTINEHNETVTNISNNPIIYNNETKQYYTYDTVTNNYYYITYEQPATPTPSPSPSPSPAPSESPTPDPGENPTPTSTPGGGTIITPGGDNPGSTSTPESGNKGDGGSSGWNPLKWLTDLLKDLIESILKGIWKLLTSIFGFILWLLSLLFKLFPWMPNSGILALCAGVVVVTVIRIIKFITGR